MDSALIPPRFERPLFAGRLGPDPLVFEGRSGGAGSGLALRFEIMADPELRRVETSRFKAQARPAAIARLDAAAQWMQARELPDPPPLDHAAWRACPFWIHWREALDAMAPLSGADAWLGSWCEGAMLGALIQWSLAARAARG